ncbi:Ankyrin repeat and SAM domain-containing protein 6 [Desmophyllum pertusum]|uniref:Ankyrin repeat and SAM domain-containing protein 6 n=1 Tax=Desmophyllum pertusum TaxID=174260 RepID=A0A9X0A0L4_9CNID|nr:Ankyrin repeat and SAM domain-containing protein 6 [Desmophyllum pertusum]
MQHRRKLSLPEEELTMFRKRALTDIVEHEEGKGNGEGEANTSVTSEAGSKEQDEEEEKQETQLPQLHQVVLDGNSELLQELINNGADINVLDESGWPPMHTAIRAGKTECAAILIKEGAGEFYYDKQKQDYLKRLERCQKGKGRKISYWSITMMKLCVIILVCSFSASYAASLCEGDSRCGVSFKPLGCFKDKRDDRALPHYIYNERDSSIDNYGGQKVNWADWENWLPGFICRCAKKAKELGYDVIGVQFYGECHAGFSSSHQYDMHGSARRKDCIGTDRNDCNERKFCAGKQWRNMVYKIVDLCSVSFERIGCFNDTQEAPRLLPSYLLNDRDEQLPSFSGQLIKLGRLVRAFAGFRLPLCTESAGKRLEAVWCSVLG